MSSRLLLTEELAARIRAHGAETYPCECCGALLGRDLPVAREVLALFPLINRREDSPQNRFSLLPDDVRAADRAAREQELSLLGWYHSHPDHPALPSEYDREHAWPWYSYVIVSVPERRAGELTSWRLRDDRSQFQPEEIEIRLRASV